MGEQLYAQLDENNMCHTVSNYKTEIIATYDNIGQKYINGVWEEVAIPVEPTQPTNSEVAQMISDLQADLIIAGVI